MLEIFFDKQKKHAKYCEQFKAIEDISHSLKKIQRNIDEVVPMMKEINEFLPESEKLEKFNI